MLMDDESIGVNMDSGLCDQISNVLEMMVRSCPFKNACVGVDGVCWFTELLCDEGLGSSKLAEPELPSMI